jgi:hypothetical protein
MELSPAPIVPAIKDKHSHLTNIPTWFNILPMAITDCNEAGMIDRRAGMAL